MIRHGNPVLAALTAILVVAAAAAASEAFKFVAVGEPLPEMRLAAVDGEPLDYLGGDGAEARFFAFVKEGRTASLALLDTINVLQGDFADRPVHWSLILSGRSSAGWPDTVAARCPGALVLIDENDSLYGQLGVPLTPVIGIGDGDRRLGAYLTYRKINYRPVIAAHLKHLLGDISQEELTAALHPSGRARDTAAAGTARKLKLSRILLAKQKTELALKQAESAVETAPQSREAWELLAEIRLANGDEAGADEAARKAEELDAGPESPEGSNGTDGNGH